MSAASFVFCIEQKQTGVRYNEDFMYHKDANTQIYETNSM